MKYKKAIIWDWNGTLLDDIELCVACMNSLLSDRNIKILDKSSYREIFTFPVKEYYEKAGFEFNTDSFEVPAMQFIDMYYKNLDTADLFPQVNMVLQYFANKGYNQSVLSAMEHEQLVLSLNQKGIFHFFENVTGIDDHFAHSKMEIGMDLLEKLPFLRKEIVLIGDTLHDLEVAEALKIDCILIANGHQSRERLENKNTVIVNKLEDVIGLI